MPLLSIGLESASSVDSLACWYSRMEEAERGEGWLAWCRDHDLYLAHSEELIGTLSSVLNRCPQPVLEVGAGRGELAAALRAAGLEVIPADPSPLDSSVIALNASEALNHYRPRTVLSCFLPVDAGIEAEVMRYPSVRNYLYIGPLIMGRTGPEALWRARGWNGRPLPEVNRVLISRLDFLADFTRQTHHRGAAAVLFEGAGQ